jgi:2-polyprenyl-3-methyl-5-hydroxy-6-metoxy-1,4-benzoquinol methylase
MKIASEYYEDSYIEEYTLHKNRYLQPDKFQKQKIANIKKLIETCDLSLILDIGCGIGTVALLVSQKERFVVAQDYAKAGLIIGKEIANKEDKQISWLQGGIENLPYRNQVFKTIIAADLFEHLDDEDSYLLIKELRRILLPDGQLAIYSPDKNHILERFKSWGLMKSDESHIGLRNRARIQAITEKAGFKTIKSFSAPSHIPVLKTVEIISSRLPVLRTLFSRRICWLGHPI